MKRYYIESINYARYPNNEIKSNLKKAGAKYIRTANKFGWSNQPQVICFNATQEIKQEIERILGRDFRVWLHWQN